MSREDQKALTLLGERLIAARGPIALSVLALTAFFGWRASHLRMSTDLDELLPHGHPFVEVHDRYADVFGADNNLVVMIEAPDDGGIFTQERLALIHAITAAVDRLPGVNHNQIDSIAHRTTRHLEVGAAGKLRAVPLMLGPPRTDKEVAAIRRVVHSTDTVHGRLVSLDDKAALVRASFTSEGLDYRKLFDQVREQVVELPLDGWIGAELVAVAAREATKKEPALPAGVRIARLFPDSAAARAALAAGDIITTVNAVPVARPEEIARAVADAHGAAVEIGYTRGKTAESVTLTEGGSDLSVSIAGEPWLYGWIYEYGDEIVWIFAAAVVFVWALLYLYFHDWRGALRPTVTGVIAATWGLGFLELAGFALDPLALVIPFFITARAVSHSVQMHDRYYQEYLENGFHKRRAILATFAHLSVPTFSGIVTDALGLLVMILVPVVLLQKLAVTAAFWILAITVAELVLNPILYDLLREPDEAVVQRRSGGSFYQAVRALSEVVTSARGRTLTLAFWLAVCALCATQWPRIIVGDPTSGSSLLAASSPYNQAHARIQEKFQGIEPLLVVAEGHKPDAMKDPRTLRAVADLQHELARDPAVGSSYSIADVVRSINSAFHDLEPKWAVIPERWVDIGQQLFIFFQGAAPTETSRLISTDYRVSHATFYLRDHEGPSVERVVTHAERFIEKNPLEGAELRLGGGLIGVLAAANREVPRNLVLMNALAFAAIFVVLGFTYRSLHAAFLMLLPLAASNFVVMGFMGWRGLGLSIHTLPVITVGVGFGIDYGIYLMSRTIEAYQGLEGRFADDYEEGRLRAAVLDAMTTSGKAVTFTAWTTIFATLFWTVSKIRFDAEMGLLLGLWMAVAWAASLTLLPVLLLVGRPTFLRSQT